MRFSANAPEVAEPASTIPLQGTALSPIEIEPSGSARGKAGWVEGRLRRPEPATFLLADGAFLTLPIPLTVPDDVPGPCDDRRGPCQVIPLSHEAPHQGGVEIRDDQDSIAGLS